MAYENRRIWITWEIQRRNQTLSKALGAKLFQFDFKLNWLLRYPITLLRTFFTFIVERPNIIFVQNPSIVLSFFAVNYGRFFNILVIIDAHNAGVYPLDGAKEWANRIAVYLFRFAAFTIVTNDVLAKYVKSKGGKSVVLPDPIPEFAYQLQKKDLKGKFNVLFICSWASDEPYLEVIKAARLLNKTIYIYITGNSKGKEKEFGDRLPENVILTGYLSEEDFILMLQSCDLIIDLTTRKNCLVCGAYEAVAVEKPLIVSNSEVLKEYFFKGTLYTNNTSEDLAKQIGNAIKNINILKKEIKELKNERITEWARRKDEFESLLLQKDEQ